MPKKDNSGAIRLQRYLKYAVWAMYTVDIASLLWGAMGRRSTLFFCITMLPCILCLMLYLWFLPHYQKGYAVKKQRRGWQKACNRLDLAMFYSSALAFAFNLNINVTSHSLVRLAVFSLIAFTAITALLVIKAKLRGKAAPSLKFPIISAILISIAMVFAVNCLPTPVASEHHTALITDKDKSVGLNTYHCITLEYESESEKVFTTKKRYDSVSVGDTIDISVNTGILGIQYIESED